jgi:5,10-methylenetetrahydromethanopterin reductase
MQINLDLALLQMYPPDQLVRVVQLCERVGYRTFRYGNEKYFRDPWIGLAVAAEHTRTLRLSTFVQDPFTLHPALTAVAIATLDELSGGRAELVLGAGGGGGGALGYQRVRPARAIRETIEVVRGLLRGERVQYDGEVVRFGGGRLNFPARADLPILVASRGNLVLQTAGRYADGVMIATYATPPGVAHALAQIDKGLARAGRTRGDIAINSRVDAWVHRDPRVAQEALRPMIAGFLTTSYPDTNFVRVAGQEVSPELEAVLAKKDRDHSWANAHLVSDALLAQFCWAGTAEQVAQQIAAVVRLGITDVTVTLHPPHDATPADVEEVIRSFAEDVKPLAEELSGQADGGA